MRSTAFGRARRPGPLCDRWALKHYHYDIFKIPENKLEEREANLVGTRFMFRTNWDGDIDRLCVDWEPELKEIVFTRQQVEPVR